MKDLLVLFLMKQLRGINKLGTVFGEYLRNNHRMEVIFDADYTLEAIVLRKLNSEK